MQWMFDTFEEPQIINGQTVEPTEKPTATPAPTEEPAATAAPEATAEKGTNE